MSKTVFSLSRRDYDLILKGLSPFGSNEFCGGHPVHHLHVRLAKLLLHDLVEAFVSWAQNNGFSEQSIRASWLHLSLDNEGVSCLEAGVTAAEYLFPSNTPDVVREDVANAVAAVKRLREEVTVAGRFYVLKDELIDARVGVNDSGAVNPVNQAVAGAFLAEGLHAAGYDAVIGAWQQGCLELVYAVCAWAPVIEKYLDGNSEQAFPGVFHYEVTSSFGQWFGEVVRDTGAMPDHELSKRRLARLMAGFFAQDDADYAIEEKRGDLINMMSVKIYQQL